MSNKPDYNPPETHFYRQISEFNGVIDTVLNSEESMKNISEGTKEVLKGCIPPIHKVGKLIHAVEWFITGKYNEKEFVRKVADLVEEAEKPVKEEEEGDELSPCRPMFQDLND